MKKILLGFLSIISFGTMYADALRHQMSEINELKESIETIYYFDSNNDLFQDDSFKISPNPSKDKLNIRMPKASQNLTLEVYDVLGKRIHKSTITQLATSIDVSSWKTGVYLVKVSNKNETQTKRFIKQ
ncbi:T9SS type A sorting domain-containing protein [Winogradskyella litoriviva]|uniref:T9SS type A sorting domain-containing protein n=1 Tax=Winogradskyella litoriviva TaxID=1220182 RepID=A0ABX2E6R2_9FLAO|nr:T9SS type A sorting domain-containing protein [Winogradskyella litoriviva]NRD24017.1 T9SS type A sorting domain-containing protein [Winogradskyella litoriviva]